MFKQLLSRRGALRGLLAASIAPLLPSFGFKELAPKKPLYEIHKVVFKCIPTEKGWIEEYTNASYAMWQSLLKKQGTYHQYWRGTKCVGVSAARVWSGKDATDASFSWTVKVTWEEDKPAWGHEVFMNPWDHRIIDSWGK